MNKYIIATQKELNEINSITEEIKQKKLMDKAIEHGKEHRKPWRGSARSKNFDKTCHNHGS